MYFNTNITSDQVIQMIKPKLIAIVSGSKNGIDIEIKEHKKNRTKSQNDYLWSVYDNIVKFWHDTGFSVDDIGRKIFFINTPILHEYFKCRLNIKSTATLSTKEFVDYVDNIQFIMNEQSAGMYDPIIPEDNYLIKTGATEENYV